MQNPYLQDCLATLLRNKTFAYSECSRQPVIPGARSEARNPGKKNWIPACAGMTARETRPVSASTLNAHAMDDSQ